MVAYSDVIDGLRARCREVAERYAPGGYIDAGKYWALNPGRADKTIGSFYVNLAGGYLGKWYDHATGERGDLLDLIRMGLNTDQRGAFDEARRFLGMVGETPAQAALRKRQAERARIGQERAAAEAMQNKAKQSAAAHALWLRCQSDIVGTPVDLYLAGRGIGVAQLGRIPHAIRFHPGLRYYHEDAETGEIFEGVYPAMVTAIHGPAGEGGAPRFWGAHQTWLARDVRGIWRKAPVPKSKKVTGQVKGGFIRLWSGIGPRGGKGASLSRSQALSVIVTEGIENGLSAAVLKPAARVLVGVSLGNLAEMALPASVQAITFIRDNDEAQQARDAADRAIATWRGQGRAVGVWANHDGGNDLNDALRARLGLMEDAG